MLYDCVVLHKNYQPFENVSDKFFKELKRSDILNSEKCIGAKRKDKTNLRDQTGFKSLIYLSTNRTNLVCCIFPGGTLNNPPQNGYPMMPLLPTVAAGNGPEARREVRENRVEGIYAKT